MRVVPVVLLWTRAGTLTVALVWVVAGVVVAGGGGTSAFGGSRPGASPPACSVRWAGGNVVDGGGCVGGGGGCVGGGGGGCEVGGGGGCVGGGGGGGAPLPDGTNLA